MICESCREAADWIPAPQIYDDIPGVAASEREQVHQLCVGAGSCACQHRVRAEKISEGEHVDG